MASRLHRDGGDRTLSGSGSSGHVIWPQFAVLFVRTLAQPLQVDTVLCLACLRFRTLLGLLAHLDCRGCDRSCAVGWCVHTSCCRTAVPGSLPRRAPLPVERLRHQVRGLALPACVPILSRPSYSACPRAAFALLLPGCTMLLCMQHCHQRCCLLQPRMPSCA